MVTTKKKPLVHIQQIKREESKYTTTKCYMTKEVSKKGTTENQ